MTSFLPRNFTGIQLTKIQYGSGGYPLFNDLTAQFSLGEIAVIIGPNGGGKSTLLRMIAGIVTPRQGEVLYQTQSIWQNRSYQQCLGYVPALPALYSQLTVLENLRICLRLKRLRSPPQASTLLTTLEQTNLLDYQQVLFGKLSAGLKKRVMLASQLVHQPTILLLDEPCAELDPLQRQQLWQLLEKLKDPRRLIILSSHHPQEILAYPQQVTSWLSGEPSSNTSVYKMPNRGEQPGASHSKNIAAKSICDQLYCLQQGKLILIPPEQVLSPRLWQRPRPLTADRITDKKS